MPHRHQRPWWYLAIVLAANLSLLLPNAAPLRVVGALLLVGLLPGLSWGQWLLKTSSPLLGWTTAAALSYTITSLATLFLYYLPGPLPAWQLLSTLDIVAVLPLIIGKFRQGALAPAWRFDSWMPFWRLPSTSTPLLLILSIALLLRAANLHYSEFQGDEALAMIAAAEALEGHEDALFLRSKGPGEVLLPMALWRLSGTINEAMARLPFTMAAMLAIASIYLIGTTIGGARVGWLAAAFFAFNGFMVAFGRIVQYQALVVWLSAMAFLMGLRWRQSRQQRFAGLSGLCLGAGLLAHYDAILVLPAIIWLLLPGVTSPAARGHSDQEVLAPTNNHQPAETASIWPMSQSLASPLKAGLLLLATLLLVALPFYLPFALDPQANRTGDYVGGRIGSELRNNLPDFFHFNTFYSSAYYIILTGLLVLALLIWFIRQMPRNNWWLTGLVVISVTGVSLKPDLLAGKGLNLSAAPFALLFLGAFLSLFWLKDKRAFVKIFPLSQNEPIIFYQQALVAWLAVPFLGYNFVVALGLTHIYTIVPAWSLLAGLAWFCLFDSAHYTLGRRWPARVSTSLLGAGLALSTIFLWNAFVRHDVEYWQDYPTGNLSFFWTPYDTPPGAGFFGFAHRSGWKAVGQKIATGELSGDYGSNEEPDITTWYTRGAPRACDPQPEFYFLAADLIDPIEVPAEIIQAGYQQIGAVTLPNQKQMRIMQQRPASLKLGQLDEAALAREFDRNATPAAFARSARGLLPAEANFGNLVRLIGYDLDTQRAYPGGRVPVTLYWQALAPLPASYQVFTHLESASGPVAQADGVPVCWSYPTDLWRPGQIIADQHAIPIPAGLPPGDYPLEVGLYLPDNFERLEILDEAGNPAGTSLTLATVKIEKTELRN